MKKVSINWKKVAYSFLTALLFSIIVIIPDYLLRIFSHNYVAHFHANTFVLIFCFMASLFLIKSNKFFITVLSLVWILMTCSLFYLFHFGRYFIGSDINLLFVETEDIALGFFADLFDFWYLPIMCIILFALSILLRKKTYKYIYHSNKFIIVFLCAFLYYPYSVSKVRNLQDKYFPSSVRYIFRNGMNSISMFLIDTVSGNKTHKTFLPYEVKKERVISEPTTIILFMGESVSSNNMSLYGYERKTTPQLETLKNDKNFVYRRAISSSIRTGSSIPMFFNLQKEAENDIATLEGGGNLFKLAKNQDFQTVLYSPQNSMTFSQAGLQYVDRTIYRDNARKEYAQKADEYTLELLKSTPLKDKNLIVMQTRAIHFPYANIYKPYPQYDVYKDEKTHFRINTYDNAMLYFDDFLYRVINWAKTLKGKVYFVMTSDHGQMMGQDNLWGHSFLNKHVAEVPFMLYTKNVSQKDLFGYNNPPKLLTHYDIGKFVAKILGYDIKNPNTPENIYYINGIDISGNAGFIKYKTDNGKFTEIK